MGAQLQRTTDYLFDGVHRVDYIQQWQLVYGVAQNISAMQPSLGANNFSFGEGMQDFGEVVLWNFGDLGDFHGGLRFFWVLGQAHDGSEGVFCGLRNHGIVISR